MAAPAARAQTESPAAAPAATPGATPPASDPAATPAQKRHHALSLIGEPKYPPDFKHFDWVNPDAPKGGTLRGSVEGTFDCLNPFSVQGVPAASLGVIYDSLMATSPDEPSTEYGLIAEWVSYPDDFSSVTFGLRPEARFHDGTPITPEDVIFSLEALKKAHPRYAFYYKNVVKAEKTGENQVTFTFDSKGNRELPQIVGQLPVLPKHFWEAKGANGEPRDLTKSTLEMPLGSGPYRIKSVDPGRAINYERVKDYWAKDLPVSKGQWNFDEIKLTYFRDRTPAFEEFKSGKLDFWREQRREPMGDRLRLRRGQEGPGQEGGDPGQAASRRCRPSSSTCGASSSRTRACGRPSTSPSTSRTPTRSCSTISTSRRQLSSTTPSSPPRACRRAANSRS